MHAYLEALGNVITYGEERTDRTGTGTFSQFGKQIIVHADPAAFPLLTTKKMFTRGIVGELLWFLSGSTNINDLKKYGNITIWDEWADEGGELGPVYGKQWRKWEMFEGAFISGEETEFEYFKPKPIDQIATVIDELKRKPDSRRLVVSAWNVADLGEMRLQPCHVMFQLYVRDLHCKYNDKPVLDMQMYQRSADIFLGVPFNIASYALLLNMIAQVVNMTPGKLITTYGDLHLYKNHIDQAREQLARSTRRLPQLWLDPEVKDIDAFTLDDIKFHNYNPHDSIKADVAV